MISVVVHASLILFLLFFLLKWDLVKIVKGMVGRKFSSDSSSFGSRITRKNLDFGLRVIFKIAFQTESANWKNHKSCLSLQM